jgi:hypothetical protein
MVPSGKLTGNSRKVASLWKKYKQAAGSSGKLDAKTLRKLSC